MVHLRIKPIKPKLADPAVNRKIYGQLIYAEESDKAETLAPGVYLVGGADFFGLVNENTESVDYYASLGKTTVSGKTALYQSLVWRDGSSNYTGPRAGYSSLAGYVFFEHIFPKSGFIIATDSEQTTPGQSFWFNRLRDAFRLGYSVYVVSKGEVMAELPGFEEVQKLKGNLWVYKSHQIRLAISKYRFDVPKTKVP